jgi:hypothetical protein
LLRGRLVRCAEAGSRSRGGEADHTLEEEREGAQEAGRHQPIAERQSKEFPERRSLRALRRECASAEAVADVENRGSKQTEKAERCRQVQEALQRVPLAGARRWRGV